MLPTHLDHLRCNCQHVAPTMPTFRSEHLADCPAYLRDRLLNTEAMAAAHAEAAELLRNGDKEGMTAFLLRDAQARAHAAWLRSRAPRDPCPVVTEGDDRS